MADGRREDQWQHTASVLAMLHNINRGKGTAARKPAEFMPKFRREAVAERPLKVPLTVLRDAFLPRRGKE